MAETPRFEGFKRRVYLGATALGGTVLVMAWALQVGRPDPEPFVMYGHPLLLVMCVWAAAWLLTGRPLVVAEGVVFVTNGLAVLAQLFLALRTRPDLVTGLSSSAYWMLVAVSILSFLMFSNRQAAGLTGGFYALGVLLPWLALGDRGPTPNSCGCNSPAARSW